MRYITGALPPYVDGDNGKSRLISFQLENDPGTCAYVCVCISVSQGSVATHVSCDEIVNDDVIVIYYLIFFVFLFSVGCVAQL